MLPLAAPRLRRLALLCLLPALALAACGGPEADFAAGDEGLRTVRLRTVAANLTSGTKQSYQAPGTRILQALKPDVVLLQEFNVGGNSAAEIDAWVHSTFGLSYSWSREAGKAIANGVVSRWPIVASGSWADPKVSDRGMAWAKIALPGTSRRFLWAVSLHLHTKTASHAAEAAALVDQIGKTVPASDLLVLGGDLNTTSRTDAGVQLLGSVVDVNGPWPVDNLGNENTNATRSKPYDWMLADPELRAREVPVTIGGARFPSGLVVDTRVFSPLSSLPPMQGSDSGATAMQHMAVVRDFALP